MRPGGALARTLAATGSDRPVTASCAPLPPGTVRRIVFGRPSASTHGLGLRVVASGAPLTPPRGFVFSTFDHAAPPTVCVPLGPGNAPVSEVWELVNIAGQDHNFHLHQARFELLSGDVLGEESRTPRRLGRATVLHDNVPVPRGGPGCDDTVEAWQTGACVPSRVVVRIPFTIAGDFVYHCHILGHEECGDDGEDQRGSVEGRADAWKGRPPRRRRPSVTAAGASSSSSERHPSRIYCAATSPLAHCMRQWTGAGRANHLSPALARPRLDGDRRIR